MKRNVLIAMTGLLALWAVSCGKNDTDSPNQPDNNAPTKKIKEVNYTYIDVDYIHTIDLIINPRNLQSWRDIYNEKSNNAYTLKKAKTSYEYNEAGKITKVTESNEGKEDRVKQFAYEENKIIIKLKNDEGQLETHELPLDKNGNPMVKGYVFNSEGQMVQHRDEKLTWENGNLLKVERELTALGEKETIERHFSYYTDKPNKNKFLLWDVEGMGYLIYGFYFDSRMVFPYGIATKNLVKSIEFTSKKTESSKSDYIYTYDADGYVTSITEQAYGREGGLVGITYLGGDRNLDVLGNFVERVKQSEEKGFTYKFISDVGGKLTYEIIQPMKIAQDANGKPINLLVDKVYEHTISYTENNGVRTYNKIDLSIFFREKMITTYQITY